MKCKSGFYNPNTETYVMDGVKYCKSNNRMMYNPEFHDNHGAKWSEEDIAYMVQMKSTMKWHDISLALGRTQNVCMHKYYTLKREDKLDYYMNFEVC